MATSQVPRTSSPWNWSLMMCCVISLFTGLLFSQCHAGGGNSWPSLQWLKPESDSATVPECKKSNYTARILMYEPFMMHIEDFLSPEEREYLHAGYLNPRVEKYFDGTFEGDVRCPKGLEYIRHGSRLLDEMANLFKAEKLLEEKVSHGQNELYDAIGKLSDTELDCVYVSSKLGTTSHGQSELVWKHKNKAKAQRFFHAIQKVWKHLKGRAA